MALIKKIDGGWQGVITQHRYLAPQENAESAEAQERGYAKTLPLSLPKNVKPGSPEEALYKMQEEALSNVQRSDVQDTSLAFRGFVARHPECANNDYNTEQLTEYFAMKGVPIVQFNGAYVPLATSVEQWEQAYEWKLAMGSLQVNPSIADSQQRLKAVESARKSLTDPPSEDELYEMPWAEFEKKARGQ